MDERRDTKTLTVRITLDEYTQLVQADTILAIVMQMVAGKDGPYVDREHLARVLGVDGYGV